MHIRSKDEKEKMRSDKDKKIVLNIPVKGKKEIAQSEIYRGNSLLNYEDEINCLQQTLAGINLSHNAGLDLSFKTDLDYEDSSSSSDSEVEELQKNVVSKGPIKYENKEIRPLSQPYPIQVQNIVTRRGRLQSGGDIIGTKFDSYTITSSQIPQSVADFISPVNESPFDVNQIYSELNENQRHTLDKVIDECIAKNAESSKITTGNQRMRSRDSELCNSPDTGYETGSELSPISIPPQSPYYSLHSPNPPNEKLRLSESDSLTSESELSPKESTIDIRLPRRNCLNISALPRQITTNVIVQPSRIQQLTINHQLPRLISRPISIQPDTEVIVNEFRLLEPAINRLKRDNIVKDKCINIQWPAAVNEAKPLLLLIQKEESRKITEYEREDIRRKKDELRKILVDLIKENPKRPFFYERLFSRIKLYQRSCFDILTGKDANGHTPLYVAAVQCHDSPLIARLIIDAVGNIDAKLDEEENTILHYLAQLGDSHAQVLSELLYSISSADKTKVNKANIMSDTALHKAVKCRHPKSCLASVKQLIKHGASLEHQDFKRQTALHLAIMQSGDPRVLLKALLQSPTASRAIDLLDENTNTALHLAASRNDLPLEIQKDLIRYLVHSGATHCIRNKQEKFAVTLVTEERRQEIKNIIHRKNF